MMATPTEISVLELYRFKQDWASAVVLKGLPEDDDDDLDIDYLDTWVGWVLKPDGDLKSVCRPLTSYNTAVIAVFDRPVNDIQGCGERLDKKKYQSKTRAILDHLGRPVGVFLPSLPRDVDDDYLRLYFESKKKCGHACEVGAVQVKVMLTHSCAAVGILEEESVLDVILSRPDHTIKGVSVTVEPYFPAYHDYIMEQMVEDVGNSSPDSSTGGDSMEIADQDIWEEKVTAQKRKDLSESPPRAFDQPQSTPPKFVRAPREAWQTFEEPGRGDNLGTDVDLNYFAQQREQKEEGSKRKDSGTSNWIVSGKQSNTVKQEKDQSNDTSSANMDFNDDFNGPEHDVRDYQLPKPHNVFTKPRQANLLDCIVDGLDDIDLNSAAGGGRSEPQISPQRAQCTRQGLGGAAKSKPKPSTAAKPKSGSPKRTDQDPNNDCDRRSNDGEQYSAGRGNDRQGKHENGNKKQKFTESADVQVKKVAHIILLKNSGFEKKRSDRVSVFLDEKQCKVIIRGNSAADITAEKLRVHDSLNSICEQTEKLSVHKAEFFSEKQTLGQIRFLCKKDKLEVAVHVSVNPPLLHCLAFKDDEANKGLQLIKDKLQVKNVKLRPGQLDNLRGQKLSDFLAKLKGTLGVAYISEDNSKVMVEGFTGKTVETTRQKVVDFLKENVVRVTTKFELNGAEAKCFQKFMQQSLDRRIRERHGSMRVEVVKPDYPMKLTLSVEGEESVAKEAKDCLNQIAKEQLDFRKISSDGTDMWLMMKGLTGYQGQPFLRRFQQDNSCFINHTEQGQVEPPARMMKQERVSPPRSSPPLPQNGPPDVTSSEGSPVLRRGEARGRQLPPGMSVYQQPDMGEDESLQIALLKSMELNQSNDASSQQWSGNEDHRPKHRHYHGREETYEPFWEETTAYGRPRRDEPPANVRPQRRHSLEANQQDDPRRPYNPYATGDFRNDGGRRGRTDSPQLGRYEGAIKYEGARRGDRVPDSMEQLYSRGAPESGDGGRDYTITMAHGAKVVLHRGAIASFKADCLVNIVGSALKLDEGTVSKAFLEVGGPQLDKLFQRSVQLGNTTVTGTRPCGDLACKSVYHLVLQKGAENCAQSVQTAVTQVLRNCGQRRYQSAAFPPLGVGRMYQYDSSAAAKAMLQATETFLSKNGFKVVTFVIYNKDDSVFSEFKKEFQDWEKRHAGAPDHRRATPHRGFPRFSSGMGVDRPSPPRSPYTPAARHNTRQEGHARRPASADNDGQRHRPRAYNQHSHDTRPSGDGAGRRESRFPKDSPVKSLTVVVFAETRDKCVAARNKLGKAIKDEFLFEERLVTAVPPQVKEKIVKVINEHNVKSIKVQGGYIIKGQRDSVNTTHKEILQILVDTGTSSDKRQPKKNAKRETHEYVRYMVEEEPDVPKYWKNFKPGQPLKRALMDDVKMFFKGKKHVKEELDSADRIHHAILSMINSTWDASTRGQGRDAAGLDQCSYTKMQVVKIERIENLDLYQDYALKRVKIFTNLIHKRLAKFPEIHKLPGCSGTIKSVKHTDKCLLKDMNSEINEFYFFHGTKPENIRAICDSGLDNRLAGANAMFGQGIYGAETPSKADQYVDDQANRTSGKGHTKQMFLMRMILGNAFVCHDTKNPHKYKRPPCTTCHRDNCRDHHGLYDSVVGDIGKMFREFVVYDKGLCYPEYLISYERL